VRELAVVVQTGPGGARRLHDEVISVRQLCCMALFELTMICCNLRLDLNCTDESEGLGRRARL
jgi:hypothetical protein